MADDVDSKRAKKRGAHQIKLRELVREASKTALKDRSVQLALLPHTDPEQPVAIAPGAPGRGRQPGSLNLAPLEYQKYLIQMGGDVILRATRLANADTMQLADALMCTPLEAANLQRGYAAIAAPYQRQELPKSVELVGEQWAGFAMFMGAASRAGAIEPGAHAKAIDVVASLSGASPRTEDLQAFSVDESVVSDAAASDTPSEDTPK